MLWRWLVNGLAGCVGMLLATENDGPPITREWHEKLAETIEKLEGLRERLRNRDLKD